MEGLPINQRTLRAGRAILHCRTGHRGLDVSTFTLSMASIAIIVNFVPGNGFRVVDGIARLIVQLFLTLAFMLSILSPRLNVQVDGLACQILRELSAGVFPWSLPCCCLLPLLLLLLPGPLY